MKHTYTVQIDCANCARKVEEALNRMEDVEKASLIYVDKKLTVEVSEENEPRYAEIEEEIRRTACQIESGFKMLSYEEVEMEEDDDEEYLVPRIAIGAVFLVFGLLLEYVLTFEIDSYLLRAVFLVGLLIVGYDVIIGGIRNIVTARFLDENFLMTISTLGALIIGYWTESIAVMLFYQIGEFFEDRAVNKTRSSVKALVNLKAPFATVVTPEGIVKMKTEAVEVGSEVIIDDKPSKVAESVRISKKTQSIVLQNIVFALAVKFAILGLTAATDLINMWIAIFGDVGVLILAVLNATRALRIGGHEECHCDRCEHERAEDD